MAVLQCIQRYWVSQVRSMISVLKHGPFLELGEGVRIDLNRYISQILRILSIDLLNALVGLQAARSVSSRQKFAGAPVVFATANNPEMSAVCAYFAKNDACCVEHIHGVQASASEASPLKFRAGIILKKRIQNYWVKE